MIEKDKILTGQFTLDSLKPCDLSNCSKRQIIRYFENSYDLYESLFTSLKDESAFYKCPDRLRLPLIFYFAHTAVVYINKLVLARLIKPEERINFQYETLFETGVDEMSWDDTENFRMGPKFCWPKLDDVIEFRRQARALIIDAIERCELRLPVTFDSPMWAMFMGMEHERIHLETSSVLIRQLPIDLVRQPPSWKYAPRANQSHPLKNSMIQVPGCDVILGKPRDFPSFGWDNEYGQTTITVPTFEAAKYLTTNREFMEFVKAGGYRCQDYWSEEGWKWVQYRQACHPTFWVCEEGCKSGCGSDLASYSHCAARLDDDKNTHQIIAQTSTDYRLRLMFDIVEMPLNWPVEVNYHEAKAYCSWRGAEYRLMSEAEYHLIRGPMPDPTRGTPNDQIFHDVLSANIGLRFGSSTPVDMFEPNSLGFCDVIGNVWQWLEDHFNGLPGFKTSYFYDDFSSPCFDGRHNLIVGGSWISSGDEASRFARFAFRRHFFQHLGFRLVRNITNATNDHNRHPVMLPIRLISNPVFVLGDGTQPINIPFEPAKFICQSSESTNIQILDDTEVSLSKMLYLEYMGNGYSHAARIFARCKHLISTHVPNAGHKRALHIGCGAGRVTFELGDLFKQVIGVEPCGRAVDAALKLQSGNTVSYQFDGKTHCVSLAEEKRKKNVCIKQFTWLPNEIHHFDFVLCTRLDRMLNVKAWLVRLREILQTGGLLVIVHDNDAIDTEYVDQILHPHSSFQLIHDEEFDTTVRTVRLTSLVKQ